MDVLEAIGTLRAMRRLKPDPVSDEHIWTILDAAIKGPSGGNLQPWNFLVIRDPDTKRKIGEIYLEIWNRLSSSYRDAALADPAIARTFRSSEHLAHHLGEAPALIFVTLRRSVIIPGSEPGASIYPAVQNLMLAARSLGLGTTLTTLYRQREDEVKQLLGIPKGVDTMALIPLGWPKGKFGPAPRIPVERVTYWDRWGKTRSR
jgi:nitroreductase